MLSLIYPSVTRQASLADRFPAPCPRFRSKFEHDYDREENHDCAHLEAHFSVGDLFGAIHLFKTSIAAVQNRWRCRVFHVTQLVLFFKMANLPRQDSE